MAGKAATLDEDGGKAQAKGKLAGKKKLIMIVAAAVLLTGAGMGGYMFVKGKSASADKAAAANISKKKTVFLDMPEMIVNLAGAPGQERPVYLKLKVSLELEDQKMVPEIQPLLPRVVDNFQIFLRELRPSDLEGSAGLYRLKEELVRRVNAAVYPARVEAILFKDLLVQ
jgi:flagellar FliL protein